MTYTRTLYGKLSGQAAKYFSNRMDQSETFYKESHEILECAGTRDRCETENTIGNGFPAGYLGEYGS